MRILFVSDSLSQPSGLTGVCIELMRKIKTFNPAVEMGHVSITGEPPSIQKITKVHGKDFLKCMGPEFRIYDANVTTQNGYMNLDKTLSEFHPDIVVSNHDPWWCDALAKSQLRDTFTWVYYATIESPVYPEEINRIDSATGQIVKTSLKQVYAAADCVIPVTNMAKTVIEAWGVGCTDFVYHGINPIDAITSPVSKEQVFGVNATDFVFMCVGVNSERKMLSRVVAAFATFLEKREDKSRYKLYLHTDVRTPQGGTDLLGLVTMFGIGENVRVLSSLRVNEGEDRIALLRKYKACDAYICLPGGEGFGLGYLEAMLHAKPVIYPAHGGHNEYCRQVSPYCVPISDYIYAKNTAIRWGLADIHAAADIMEQVVNDTCENGESSIGNACKLYAYTQTWESKVKTIWSYIEDAHAKVQKVRGSIIGSSFRRYY